MSVLVRFVGGPLNGQERVLPNLISPYMVQMMRPATSLDPDDYMNYDEHRYDLDSRDYEARQAEIDRGSPALFVHEDLENIGRLLAASLGNLISFEEAYERVAEVFDAVPPTQLGPPVDTGDVLASAADDARETVERWRASLGAPADERIDFTHQSPAQIGPTDLTREEVLADFIHHTPELHRAPGCENLPPHERCWPNSGGSGNVVPDPHGYGTPIMDEAGGVGAEDLVPGIEAALREWNETKEEMEDE